jgi:uncharacterized membrane protein YhiD involved in acid resistance
MFESILPTEGIEIKSALICLGVALILGLLQSIFYMISDKKKKYSVNFAIALVILPAIVAVVIMLVGSNVARAFSVAGAFTLVRFRSVPGDSRDITSIFFAMAVGLAAGIGYVSLAAVVTVVVGLIYVGLMRSPYAKHKTIAKQLKITVPENLNYEGAFDEVFAQYTTKATLQRVKTTNLGALFELTYSVELNEDKSQKAFIDALRCRNGNLNILLTMVPDTQVEL